MADLRPPFFAPFGLSREETEAAQELFSTLSQLTLYIEEFEAAVQLFDFSEAERQAAFSERGLTPDRYVPATKDYIAKTRLLTKWQLMAGRDGAISIFNFGKTLESARTILFKSCPSWRDLAKAKTDETFSLWEAKFPRFVAIRHTVAHAGEFSRPGERDRHTFNGQPNLNFIGSDGPINLYMSASLNGREFISTFEKKIVSYEVSTETAALLSDVAQTFFDAFKPIEDATREAYLAEWHTRRKPSS